MKEYTVEVTETLQRCFVVWADSENEALDMIQEQYDNQDIVLGSEDFMGVDIEVIGEGE